MTKAKDGCKNLYSSNPELVDSYQGQKPMGEVYHFGDREVTGEHGSLLRRGQWKGCLHWSSVTSYQGDFSGAVCLLEMS